MSCASPPVSPSIHLPVGEGWQLSLSTRPPEAAPFQIVTLLEGRGRWVDGRRQQVLEPLVPWWSSAGPQQRWESDAPSRWLCLFGDRCPIPEWGSQFDRAGSASTPRCCSAAGSDAQELASIVLDCPYPCELKNLLARGKSLMLVSKALASLETPQAESYPVKLYEDDLDRLRQARSVLIERMDDPPSVPELCRLVGLSALKLKGGFHKLWGTTVYGLLRRERMAAARAFLLARRGNVSEAAGRVGYTNMSHFAEAFQQEFGCAPGTLLKSRG